MADARAQLVVALEQKDWIRMHALVTTSAAVGKELAADLHADSISLLVQTLRSSSADLGAQTLLLLCQHSEVSGRC
jgi:hypothetical protein